MTGTIPLPQVEVTARAARALCFDVVAAAGELLEQHDDGSRIVRFDTIVGREHVVTVERVTLDHPRVISYEWLAGPLPFVAETITFAAEQDGWTTMTYRGRYAADGGWLARLLSRLVVPRAFKRSVGAHLRDAKTIAEQRAARSKLHVRPPTR